MNRQYLTGSRTLAAGDLTNTYFGIYLDKYGVHNNYEYKFHQEPRPFVVRMASVWLSRPSGINPDGIKLIIAMCTSDVGRNIDLLEAPQRTHYHLTWQGRMMVDHAIILEIATQGAAAGDVFNYIAQVEKWPDREPLGPILVQEYRQ